MTEKCENCRYAAWTGIFDTIACRRYPPKSSTYQDSGYRPNHTLLKFGDWCGEWRAKDEQMV